MFEKLPWDMIREILLFNTHFIIRKQKLICINTFSRDDYRYTLLSQKPKIYHMSNNQYSVILSHIPSKKRFVLGYYCNYLLHIREYFFHTFTYDYLMKHMNETPDNMICYYF